MKASDTEIEILKKLAGCSYLPGSFDKKFPREIDVKNISPLQKYWIYKLGYKYRKQIKNDIMETICKNYIDSNTIPLSRKEAQKQLKKVLTEQKSI